MTAIPLISRILLSIIFIVSGISKLAAWNATAAMMTAAGLPLVPLLLLGAVVIELVGGLMLLVGLQTRAVALIIALYLIPTTLLFHRFWGLADAQAAQGMLIHFMKNLAIMGGLWHVAFFGAGAYSVDDMLSTRRGARAGARRPAYA